MVWKHDTGENLTSAVTTTTTTLATTTTIATAATKNTYQSFCSIQLCLRKAHITSTTNTTATTFITTTQTAATITTPAVFSPGFCILGSKGPLRQKYWVI